jgi:hypothetical protein
MLRSADVIYANWIILIRIIEKDMNFCFREGYFDANFKEEFMSH